MIQVVDYVKPIFDNAEQKGFHDKWSLKQKIVLIIAELSEAIEADRKSNRCTKLEYFENRIQDIGKFSAKSFETNIKDTLEDEIADAFIRCCDLYGLLFLNNDFEKSIKMTQDIIDGDYNFFEVDSNSFFSSFQDRVYDIEYQCINIKNYLQSYRPIAFGAVFKMLIMLSEFYNFPLEKHINLKMQYNGTRPFMHGVKY